MQENSKRAGAGWESSQTVPLVWPLGRKARSQKTRKKDAKEGGRERQRGGRKEGQKIKNMPSL